MSTSYENLSKQVVELKEKLHRKQRDCDNYLDLVEHAMDLLQSVRVDGTFSYVNKAWRQALGYSPEEVKKLNLFDIIDPGEKDHCQHLFKLLTAGQELEEIETVFLAKDGRRFPVAGKVNCKFVDGRPTITRGIFRDISARKKDEAERERLISELQEALSKVKTLRGMLPICSLCKKIRDDQGYWQRIESYITHHSNADFSHGICPNCAVEKYPELYGSDLEKLVAMDKKSNKGDK